MTSRNIEWYIESLVLRAEHVSLGPQSLVLKSRLHIGGPKVMGLAPQGGGGSKLAFGFGFGGNGSVQPGANQAR